MTHDVERMLRDWRLTTAEILYRMPDHPVILQSYTWQEVDLVPEFPELKKFLDFWEKKLDGKLHSVKVAHCEMVKPASVTYCNGIWRVH